MTPTTKRGDGSYVVLESPRDADIKPDGETVPKQASTPDASLVPLSQLFTFADATDKALIAVGTVGALAAGLSQPIQIVLFGDILNSFNPDPRDGPMTPEDFRANINEVARNFAIVGVAVIVCCFLQVSCWSLTASRQAKRIRSAYVGAILSTEMGWFDVNDPMQLPTRVVESTVAIEEGMGRKIGDGLHFVSMAVSGITIGFVKGWELALVLLALAPFIACAAFLSMKVMSTATQTSIESYASAGAIAQESLSNIRTVHMFNAIQHFVRKYKQALELSTQAGIKKGFAVGWGTGVMFFAIFSMYACGMFYGALKVVNDRRDGCTEDCYNGGRVLTVFFSVIMGAMAIGQAGPSVQAVFSARVAAFDVFATINRKSAIDPLSEEGVKLSKVEGKIEVEDVTFSYPSRPDVQVCSNYSLTIAAGETVALVGPSGSGKSTVVALLERFYDPLSGSVKIDGIDVRELNVKWLRSQIGLVGQEPVLFATSIMENIRYGSPSASDEDVVNAAKMANAYSFIMEFPQGFETEVGERGALLSGGQKQRIAIARAIIKNPRILLLDEATSALDTDSEHIVQESLAKLLASSRRTTIIVAHRLSTIRNADKIAVHSSGSIVEIGTHEELMQDPNGHYRTLVEAQNRTKEASLKETSRAHSTADDPVPTVSTKPTGDIVSVKDSDVEPLDDELQPVSVSRVWKLSLPEWKFLVFGALGAVVNASVFPVWGVLLTKVTVLFFDDSPRSEILRSARLWSLGFVCLGVVCGASIVLQHYGFAVASQRLTSRVRLATFTAMLHQEVGWFDLDENSSGALVSRLATDSATLQAMTSETLNQRLVNTTTLAIGFGIAFYYSWQMTLLLLATAPILLFNSYIQAQVLSGTINSKKNNDADTAAGSLLSEAIGSIRTVTSLGMETTIKSSYASFLETSKKDDTKTGIVGGIAFGVSQGIMFFNCAFQFYMGGKWVSDGVISFEDMFMVITVVVLCSFAVGMASQNASDQHMVKKAASRVFHIIDRMPAVDSTAGSGHVPPSVVGEIEFKSVEFAYPSRPEAKIYSNYNLKVSSGQTVALVGASGSGKSTAVSLLERFYDPAAGYVTLDGVDLRELQLPWLREHISLVSQEPVLFTGTIADNIAMGKPGATREEVVEAAKKANAFDFICNFSDGFDTDVGDRGAQVSGGQKQRIAIARAILRDPEVLLLDEATSALDNESERVVQESLDRLLALKKRTTVIVAHRLSTIRNADLIAVTKDGEIVEQGTHDELMARSAGVYKALVARQVGAVQG